MAAYPGTLPQDWLIDGYVEERDDGVLRGDMTTGPKQTRRRTSAVSTKVEAQMLLTDAQRDIFDSWFDNDLAGGANAFTHYRMGKPAGGNVTYLFREPPKVAVATLKLDGLGAATTVWRVSLPLWILP